jgi:hypothetical protein
MTKVKFDLDRKADFLSIYFYGEPRPSIEYVVDDHILLSLDPKTEEVVGLQLEGFLAHVIYEFPSFLEIADFIGLTDEEVARARKLIDPEARKRLALESFLGHVESLRDVG